MLVTGGSGFIGTNMVELLASRGDYVVNFDCLAPRNVAHRQFWRSGDLLESADLVQAMRDCRPEIVVHMAARTDLDGNSVEDYAANTVGVENLINAAQETTSIRKLIVASTRLVCRIGSTPPDEFDYYPTTPYGESKVLGEQLVRKAMPRLPFPTLILRPTSIWGPWFGTPYKDFFLAIARRFYVHPSSAPIPKSFGFVGNTVYELARLMEAAPDAVGGRMFYLADYPPIDLSSMATAIQRAIGAPPVRTVKISTLRRVAGVGDVLKRLGWKNPPLTSFRLNNLLTPMVHDLGPLEALVGALPFTMEQGVQTTVDWLRSQGHIQ